jgi:septum formation inhibitor MinC
MINSESLNLHEVDIEEICNNANESINTATSEIKDNIILDLSNQLKEKFDQLEKIEYNIKKKNKKIIKHFLRIYGLVKSIDKISNETVELPIELQSIIDILNDSVEDFLDSEFFPNCFLLYDE